MVVQKGNYTNEVLFTIKFANGTVVYNRPSGTSFVGTFVLKTFCLGTCPISTTLDLYVTMTDTWGDTWNGNVLAFKQGTTLQEFSLTIDNMKSYGPIKLTISRMDKVDIVVSQMGSWT